MPRQFEIKPPATGPLSQDFTRGHRERCANLFKPCLCARNGLVGPLWLPKNSIAFQLGAETAGSPVLCLTQPRRSMPETGRHAGGKDDLFGFNEPRKGVMILSAWCRLGATRNKRHRAWIEMAKVCEAKVGTLT